jgi:hypothetical protein
MMQRLWLLLIFLMIAVNPQPATSADRPPFILNDSGFQASSRHRIYWLDNDRVIFTGYEIDLEKIDKEGRYGREQNIYIWDTRENRRTVYVKNASLGCYFRGYIRYSILNGPSKKGPMGQERTYLDMYYSKETWEGEPPEWEEGVKMHPITCKSYRPSHGKWQSDIVQLLPEHGYLDFAAPKDLMPGQHLPIIWRSEGGNEVSKLSLLKGQVWPQVVRYAEFLNAYVLYGYNFLELRTHQYSPSWPNDLPHAVWLFSPNGTIKELQVPGPYSGWYGFFPMRKGVFAASHGQGRKKQLPGDVGGYWVQDDRVQKIISEEIGPDSISVSPDGCRIAFSSQPHESRQSADGNSALHMLEVCKGE